MSIFKRIFHLDQYDIIMIIKRALVYILAMSILYTIFSHFIYQDRLSEYKKITYITDEANANFISFSINHYLLDLKDDLLVLKNSNEMAAYISQQDDYNTEEVEKMFLRFSENKTDLSQIRIIDNQGNEKIRVNHINEPELVREENLQDKSNRYYFEQTILLDDGEVYISHLDLNIENNEIDIPYQPVIRISTPLYNMNSLIGILVVNLDAKYLLSSVFASQQTNFSDNISLFNDQGFYIYNSDESILYGHIILTRQNFQLSSNFPEIITELNSNQDHTSYDDKYYTLIKIDPFSSIHAESQNGEWLIVHESDLNEVVPSQHIIFTLDIYDISILGLVWLVIIFASYLAYIHKKDGFKLNVVRRIADETSDSVVISNEKKLIEYANKSFSDFSGYQKGEILNHHTRILKSHIHTQSLYDDLWKKVTEQGYWSGILWQKKKNGLIFPKHMMIYEMRDEKSKRHANYVSLSKDLASSNTFITPNTSLSDNHAFATYLKDDLLKYQINLPAFNETMSFGVIALTLIHNEEHNKNDDLNIENVFIAFVKESFKEQLSFIVKISQMTYIIGFHNYKNESNAKEHIENVLSQRLLHVIHEKHAYVLTFKAGVYITSKFHDDYISMISHAYTTLRYINVYDQTQIAYYSEDMAKTIARGMQIAHYLQNGISNNEFYIVYQPQIDTIKNKIIGYEVLLRWHNDVLGHVSPYEFIRIAEDKGLIVDIGYWVIEEAFKHCHQMNLQGKKLSINISPIQFLDQKLASEVSSLAAKYQIQLADIEFEVTESVLVTDFNLAQNRLKTFKSLGISIAIDDFGTGYSSLQYISKFDVNKLKLDRSFIKDYQPGDKLLIAKHVINLSNDLNIKVICEGTETIEQINYLKSIGAHIFQGYYYAKPMILSEIKTFEQSFK